MKKLVVTLCLLTVLLSFAGCGENSSKQDGTGAAEKAKDLTWRMLTHSFAVGCEISAVSARVL